MTVGLRTEPFDPWYEIQHQQKILNQQGKYGATAIFIGSMRDINQNTSIQSMYIEHYPSMTEKHLEKTCDTAKQKWDLIHTVLLHRVGKIKIAETIVLICVWSMHRADAFDACRFMIENLKSKAPFWKKETTLAKEDRWLSSNN